jgi:hypothetical protein
MQHSFTSRAGARGYIVWETCHARELTEKGTMELSAAPGPDHVHDHGRDHGPKAFLILGGKNASQIIALVMDRLKQKTKRRKSNL